MDQTARCSEGSTQSATITSRYQRPCATSEAQQALVEWNGNEEARQITDLHESCEDGEDSPALLDELNQANRLFGVHRLARKAIAPMAEQIAHRHGKVRILDVGCGTGGLLTSLGRDLARRGIRADLHGIDLNPLAIRQANENARRARDRNSGIAGIRYECTPLSSIPDGASDLLISTFVLHHLTNAELTQWMRETRRVARWGTWQLDFRPSPPKLLRWGWQLSLWATGFSQELRQDGQISVERAWHREQIEAAARNAGWSPRTRPCLGICQQLLAGPWNESLRTAQKRNAESLKSGSRRPSLTAARIHDSAMRQAITEWQRVLGKENVLESQTAQTQYGANTLGLSRYIPTALRPSAREQIPELVRIAARHRIPLYPISTGRNWGYGSANPAQDGSALVDLSRLQCIEVVDAETGLVRVQPGVTQRMLADFVSDRNLPFMTPVSGAGPEASILGNALERGYGITPHTDHFGALTSLEAVLPDGSWYRPALSALGGERVDAAFKWGLGPYMDGLFTQGGFGIVTEGTIALAPKAECVEAFLFEARDDAGLEALVTCIGRALRELGGNLGGINLMNDLRVLSMTAPYPAHHTSPEQALPDDVVAQLARQHRIRPWSGLGAFYGSPRLARAMRKEVKRILRGHVKRLVFVTPLSLRVADAVLSFLPCRWTETARSHVAALRKTMQILKGEPDNVALPLAYWRAGKTPREGAADPARDGVGLSWYAPLIPLKPDRVRAFVELTKRICRDHGMDTLITLTSMSPRCFDATVPLLFDRHSSSACERASACYRALFEAGRAEGFLPYRLSVQAMDEVTSTPDTCWKLAAVLKNAVDPHNIMAPGRYIPDASARERRQKNAY